MEPLNEHDELKREAPTLAGLPKADPFVVPEPFFDHFPHHVQAVVAAKGRRSTSWAVRWRLAIALPVVALLTFGAWHLLRTEPVIDTQEIAVTPLTDEELMAYDDIDPLSVVEVEEVPQLGEVTLDLNDEDLLAYFEEEHTDLAELITETE